MLKIINNGYKQYQYDFVKKYRKKILAFCICFIIFIPCTMQEMTADAAENISGTDAAAVSPQSGGELHAFYPSNTKFSEQLKEYIDQLDSISFAWSSIDADNPGISFYYPKDYLQPVEYAKSKGKSIQLNVYMKGSDSAELLPDSEKQSVMIQAILNSMQTDITNGNGIYYDGVVIDFEGLRNTDSNKKPIQYDGQQISTYFSRFLTELKTQLTSMGKKLYVAVNPLIYYDGYNYSDILDVADRVIVMAHDYEPTQKLQKAQVSQYSGYNALEPIYNLAPFQQVRQTLNDMQKAASNSSQLSKVWLQIAFDSAQWRFNVSSAKGWEKLADTALSREGRLTPLYKSIKARVDNTDGYGQNIAYGYNNELQSPYIQYFNSSDKSWNVILYEDSNSISAKIGLAKTYGLGGISLWSLANMPDYTDSTGKKFYLDGWTTILSEMGSYDKLPSENSKYVSFTDKAMEQAVREKLGKTSGKITVTDIQSIYRLKLPKGVKSLKDLKKLTNLEYLDAGQQNLKDITSIGYLTKLRVLYLQRNAISNISALKKLTKLEVLSLNGNGLSDLKPLAKLTKLEKLYLRDNKITSITSLKGLINLKELYLAGNKITDYNPVKKMFSKSGFLCDFNVK